ncbi:MAG TPA: ABC transporter ATP-binding protein [Longimicrobiales bacterium]
MIEVDGLTRYYGDFAAVTDLSFRVEPGEVVGMLGPNGAGKTTTLRSLVGIIRPTRGSISISGHDLLTDPVPAKRQLAFIPDEPQLFEHLTVREHLQFMARIYNVADAGPRIDQLLEELELNEKTSMLPDALSRGMKQKLAIACGLLHDPRALLLDEPLTGLDPGAIRKTKQTILRQAERGAAVILSSHLLSLVEELCTRLLVIDRGRLVAAGTIEEIARSKPELEGRGLEELFLALTGSA